jgi:hypothetical protein
MQTGSPDEIAYTRGWITDDQLLARIEILAKNGYGAYLKSLLPGGINREGAPVQFAQGSRRG